MRRIEVGIELQHAVDGIAQMIRSFLSAGQCFTKSLITQADKTANGSAVNIICTSPEQVNIV